MECDDVCEDLDTLAESALDDLTKAQAAEDDGWRGVIKAAGDVGPMEGSGALAGIARTVVEAWNGEGGGPLAKTVIGVTGGLIWVEWHDQKIRDAMDDAIGGYKQAQDALKDFRTAAAKYCSCMRICESWQEDE